MLVYDENVMIFIDCACYDIFLKRHEKNVIDQQVSCSGERNKVRNYFGERGSRAVLKIGATDMIYMKNWSDRSSLSDRKTIQK
jgi:hypothetical protein